MVWSEGDRSEWNGLAIVQRGLRCEVEWAAVASGRGGSSLVDPVAAAIDATEGMEVVGAANLGGLELTGAGTRGGESEAALHVDLGLDPSISDEQRVVLVEEDGWYSWFFPQAGQQSVEIPIDASAGSRGLLRPVRRVLRTVAVKTVGRVITSASRTVVGDWDERHHPYHLRVWDADHFHDPEAPAPVFGDDDGEPWLLVIHGFTGSIAESFRFESDVVAGIGRAYRGRVVGFDHPTLAVTPGQNAEWLLERLPRGVTVDVLAHSRGGLVARELHHLGAERAVTVRAITFVATPNGGTQLADLERPLGLVDAVTNLVGAVPGGAAVGLALGLVTDMVLGSALRGLVGLTAMDPNSVDLKKLNAAPMGELTVRAVCADYQPLMGAGIVKTAQDRLRDAYFGGRRNDRIVPTLSTIVTSGSFGVPVESRLVLDSSRGVDHSGFWSNERVVRQLLDWLRADWVTRPPARVPYEESEPGAEVAARLPDPNRIGDIARAVKNLPDAARNTLEELFGGPLNDKARPPTGERPAVVVIPGIMGTSLQRGSDGEMVWLDVVRLEQGHFTDLGMPPLPGLDMDLAGLNHSYLPLIAQLAERWDVVLAPFDWRADIFESATLLADKVRKLLDGNPTRPVHLVAHSMGGLVARAMAVVAPEVWQEMAAPARERSGRLVMLGTPNGGSFAIPLVLTGRDKIMKALSVLDRRSPEKKLTEVVASFPGVYQMLPSPHRDPRDDDHALMFDEDNWGPQSAVQAELLRKAKDFHEQLRKVNDPSRLVVVAGYGYPTPFRLELENPGQFKIGQFSSGDSRVAVRLAQLDDVTTYFSRSTHGGLVSAADVLAAIDELLSTGKSAKLADAEPARRDGVEEKPVMIDAKDFDLVASAGATRGPGEADDGTRDAREGLTEAVRVMVGGGAPGPSRPTVTVRVLNASLTQAAFPVVVGHQARLPLGGAELVLDTKMGGALRDRQRLGQYPEQAGSVLFVPAASGSRPRGAVVLGLGELGTLTGPALAAVMRQGVVAALLGLFDRTANDEVRALMGVSAVLVATPGRRGLTVDQCVTALAEGAITAVARVNEMSGRGRIDRFCLELVELYDQKAEEAAMAAERLAATLPSDVRDQVDLVVDGTVSEGDGRLLGYPPRSVSGTSWVQVNVALAAPDPGEASSSRRWLTFSMIGHGAQANVIELPIDIAKVRAYIDDAITDTGSEAAVSRTLYEMLFPHRAKLDLDHSEALKFVLDKDTAEIPWELLSGRVVEGGEATPPALRSGLLRQLQSMNETRERTERPSGQVALVVGDPPTGLLPRLPGARHEARQVAELFRAAGWEVEDRIYGAEEQPGTHWRDVLDALNAHPYRVVHIAAHGIYDDGSCSGDTGVVIGPEPHMRLTAVDVANMGVTPDLVFLNCCHLGRLGSFLQGASEAQRRAYEQPHRAAASVARQLLQNGVGAVVVAGWAVDDVAAAAFADSLYTALLAGYPFGEAVRLARQAARSADRGRSTTWGAYQCYGDPDFSLGTSRSVVPRRRSFVSATQLERAIAVVAAEAGDAISTDQQAVVRTRLADLQRDGEAFLDNGRVLEASALAWSELGDYPEAIEAYEKALKDRKGGAHLWAGEQLANLEVRYAVRLHREPERTAADNEKVAELFNAARDRLDQLDALGGASGERYALRGSLYKKRATTRSGQDRLEDLEQARQQYCEAQSKNAKGYHINLAIQMTALVAGAVDDAMAAQLEEFFRTTVRNEARNPSSDYWEIAQVADTLITYAVVGRTPEGIVRAPVAEAEARYEAAFRLRSTVRQRDSALAHLDDLAYLVNSEEQGESFRMLYQRLKRVGDATTA